MSPSDVFWWIVDVSYTHAEYAAMIVRCKQAIAETVKA